IELVVAQLVARSGEVAAAHLRESRHAGSDAEAIGVGANLPEIGLEEDRSERARAGEVHLATQHVDELGNLVELRALQELSDRRVEVVLRAEQPAADLPLRSLAQGAELVHRVQLLVPAHANAGVQNRAATR